MSACRSQLFAHAPLDISDVPTFEPRPVRSRLNSPSMIAPNSDIAVG